MYLYVLEDDNSMTIIIILVVGIVLVLLGIYFMYCRRTEKNEPKQVTFNNNQTFT